MPIVPLTIEQIRDGLHSGFSLDETDQFTYSIPGAGSTWESSGGNYDAANPQPTTGYSTLSAGQAANFVASIVAWDKLIAPNFTSVADNGAGHGEVRIAFTSFDMTPLTAGYAFQGLNQTPTSIVGDVWLNASDTAQSYDAGTDGFVTLLHEMGHVLGLKHSFEPVGDEIPDPYDDMRYTVMSYTAPFALVYTPTGGGGYLVEEMLVNPLTPGVLDIAAVQDLYGVDTITATGDTTYSFDEDDFTFYSIWDAGGIDTIDLSAVSRGSVVDLNAGAYSSVGRWTEADQILFYAGLTGEDEAVIAADFAFRDYYEWTDNLGIAFGTTIENLIAGSGNDTITGNGADNLFKLNLGGADTVAGGGGNDGFYFGAALTALDSVDGGAGSNDQLGLQGNYSLLLTLGAANLVNTEVLVLLSGNDTRFGDTSGSVYSYNLRTVDGNVAAGQLLTVNFNTLGATEHVTFDGTAETNGSFLTYGGQGNDHVAGGTQSDGFYFGIDRWSAADRVNGQAGGDDQLGLQGHYAGASAVTFGALQLVEVDTIVLLTGGDARFGAPPGSGYSYDVTMHDGNLAAGRTMTINANTLRANVPGIADEVLTFNGAAESDGRFLVYSGAAADTIVGSQGNDTIYGGGGADTMTGGAGNDLFAYLNVLHSVASGEDLITDFAGGDRLGLSAIDADTGTGGDQAFHLGATAGHTGDIVLAFDAVNSRTSVSLFVDGDAVADGVIWLTGNHTSLTAADFVL